MDLVVAGVYGSLLHLSLGQFFTVAAEPAHQVTGQ
jgi:hypothetical protein